MHRETQNVAKPYEIQALRPKSIHFDEKTQKSQKMVVRNVTQTRKRYKTRGMRVQKKEARATYFGSFLWIWPPIGRKQLEMQDGGPH